VIALDELDEPLTRPAQTDARKAQSVEPGFRGGLSAKREWKLARACLLAEVEK